MEFVEWSLEWSNPYTQPPEGMPRVLCIARMPRGEKPADLLAAHSLGSPYGIHLRFYDDKPRRAQLSPEALKSIRRKRLEARIRANVPLFAEDEIARRLNTNQDYYEGKEDTTL